MGLSHQTQASGTQQAKIAARETALLLEHGYCVIPGAMTPDAVAALSDDLADAFARTPRSSGAFYGSGSKRFHGLLRRSPKVAAFVAHPVILEMAEVVLGAHCDHIQLNLTQAIELLPGAEMQPPHRDEEMWPLRQAGAEYLINVMWPFTPYTGQNGATIVWPGSHRRDGDDSERQPIAVEMVPGDALVFLGSTLHAGGANMSELSRRGMIVSYCLGWLKPYELPWLAYPPIVANDFPRDVAALTGYRAHRPNLGTFEGRCPSTLLAGPQGAIDALLPAQEDAIRHFRAETAGGASS
ncbi:phytanoyl-CoA dioxygenase family protein [Sphingosinicella sp.]|uniref:phytanoyl-CoA dioxygenase family protein n=1 Tax=Sphingosinicella sp. TaxID=1917971 RepID=UPI00183F7423|nr:phytanoyl-CoA dioxygenase family protein [Sphingosinicella sp.]MBA4759001.1 phytanoyl-CoA dioxygenase family protein [Sphingosinicella sp.]